MEQSNDARCKQCGNKLSENASLDILCPQCQSRSTIDGPLPAEATVSARNAVVTGILPDRIGSYKILECVGEGGMGVVYLAEQEQPIRRKVALKVIKLGMDTQEVIARFESERQALAMMNHPNIARVHDAGTTERGTPFFVMEYVPGLPISTYCDKHRLSTRERIELFIMVCQAIQHAHQKGIIHRDIKPSNILVAMQDGRPVPKIIDFGVAKATNQRLTEKTLFTQQGVLIGTPEFMSPEQAEMTGLDVDTTTDIYSLGVLLYQLLVGALPFDAQALRRAGYEEIRRIIREQEPPKPTTRLNSLGQSAKEVAERRRTDIAALARELRGDLEWITLKAMEKDRTRRYASCSEFAADIERHLKNEPVIACPPGTAYRVRKFVRRHRIGVTIAAASILVLIVFGVTTAVQARRIALERDRANREAELAKQVSSFLQRLFSVVDPSESRGNEIRARELLDSGAVSIRTELAGQPELQAVLMTTMGSAYQGIGLLDKALPLMEDSLATLRRQYGNEHPETASAMAKLASLHTERGNYAAAEPLAKRALEISRRLQGSQHEDVASSLNILGVLYWYQGKLEASEPLLREAVAIQQKVHGNNDLTLTRYRQDLALLLSGKGELDEAERMMRENLAVEQSHYGDLHPQVVISLNNLAALLINKKDLEGAGQMFREAIDMSRNLYGEQNRHTALYTANLGYVLFRQGRYSDAKPLLQKALDIRRMVLPAESAEIGHSLLLLGRLLVTIGDANGALPLLEEVTKVWQRAYPEGNLRTADAQSVLGECLVALGRYDEAERHLNESMASIIAAHRETSDLATDTRRRLDDLRNRSGNSKKAAGNGK